MTTKNGNYVAYYRVSTDRQGKSGLGLDAQQHSVANFMAGRDGDLLEEFTEIESGRRNDRPMLTRALDLCRRKKATLVVAKLDRLSRNLAFIANLQESKVDFVACDMPEANRLTLNFMAVIAQHERETISIRTKEALQAAKARGRKLGWSIPGRDDQARASQNGVRATTGRADQFAANVLPVIRDIERAGVTTLQGIAGALNARGIKTARGCRWYAATVRLVMQRADRLEQAA